MRFIMLDTETTGLKVEEGHRLIEIGCIELSDRRVTERTLHFYVNPERDIDEGATAVHGITLDKLLDKPRFAEIAQEFVAFIAGSKLVIHNAPFDLGFLDAELASAGLGKVADHVETVIDTLVMARELHPGQRNSLDALCARYSVNNEHRVLHGALLDARLLADVYLAMTRGQDSLGILEDDAAALALDNTIANIPKEKLVVLRASPEELAAHEAILDQIDRESGGKTIWKTLAQG